MHTIKHPRPCRIQQQWLTLSHIHTETRTQREPGWQPVQQFSASDLPHSLRYWLLDDGSLTRRIIALSRGQLSVQRLSQSWRVPQTSERRLLRLPQRERAIVREVSLSAHGVPVVFARSVFPLSFLTGKYSHLRRLKSKPLGAILFKHPSMRRSPFELARMPGDCDYLPETLHQSEPAWGRRSRFTIEGKSLMVSEVFLEAFKPWPPMSPIHRAARGLVSAANIPAKQ